MTLTTSATTETPLATDAPVEPHAQLAAPHKPCGWLELILFAIGSAAVAVLLVRYAGALILYTRHFWLDEYLTSLIVLDKSTIHALKAVADGVDTNPPVYHMLLRAFYAIFRGPPETTFRIFSALCMWGGLVLVYATLRRAFGVIASIIAVLALTSNPLIIKESSEARFYAPLLLAAASFTFFYCGEIDVKRPRLRKVMLALSAIFVCTIHYFGIFIVVSVIAGDWLARGLDRRRLIPTAAGVVALLLMAPIALLQRRGLTVPTWIEPVSWDTFSQLFGVVWDMRPVCILLIIFVLSLVWRARRGGQMLPTLIPIPRLRPVGGMLGLFLVPLIILAFSWLVQPSWVSKYAIAGALAIAPIVALIATWTPRSTLVLAAAVMLTLTFFQLKDFARINEARDRATVNRGKQWLRRGEKQLFVFVARNYAYMMPYGQPKMRRRVVLVDMSESGIAPPSKYHAYELQMATKVARHYPIVQFVKPQDLYQMRAFDFCGDATEFEWLNKAVPLRRTAAGFYQPLVPAPATAPATTAATAPASTARTDAANDPPATTHAP